MTFRTEGDIILAANMAQDLTNLVVAYLEMYKKHAQGLNGVRIPTDRYTVVFRRIDKQGKVNVKLVYTKTTTWEEPDYYDADSDYFSEGFGASNVSGYSVRSESHQAEYDISLPVSVLLMSKEDMENDVIKFAKRKYAEQAEKERQNEIARLEANLAQLKGLT